MAASRVRFAKFIKLISSWPRDSKVPVCEDVYEFRLQPYICRFLAAFGLIRGCVSILLAYANRHRFNPDLLPADGGLRDPFQVPGCDRKIHGNRGHSSLGPGL